MLRSEGAAAPVWRESLPARLARMGCWASLPLLLVFDGLAFVPVLALAVLRAVDGSVPTDIERRLSLGFGLYFVWLVFATFVQGGQLSDIDNPSRWLLLPLIAWLARGDRHALPAFAVGAGVFLAWHGVQVLVEVHLQDSVRAVGMLGPVVTSQIASMLLIVIAAWAVFQRPWPRAAVLTVASTLVLVVIAYTASRGVFLALSVVGLSVLVLTRRWGFIGLLFAVMVALALSPSNLGHRIVHETSSDIAAIRQGDYASSLGLRLSFIGIAVDGVLSAPMIGQGPQAYRAAMDKAIAERRMPEIGRDYGEPHNDLLTAFYAYGFPGGLLFIASLALALHTFVQRFRRGIDAALPGILLVVFTFSASLSASIFIVQLPSAFFFTCLGLLVAHLEQHLRAPVTAS